MGKRIVKRLVLSLGLAVAGIASGAQALPIANGDLLVVLQKSGTEFLVNLGNFGTSHPVDLTAASTVLGGLEGAKVAVVGVADPGRRTTISGFPGVEFNAENILFSAAPTTSIASLTDNQIEAAMNITDSTLESTAWFWQLRSPIVTNVVPVTASWSYQNNLGVGTDAIANSFFFSIAGIITGGQLQLDIISAERGYADFGGQPQRVGLAGTLSINGNSLGYSAVPEPGTLILLSAGLAGIAVLERRARRTA